MVKEVTHPPKMSPEEAAAMEVDAEEEALKELLVESEKELDESEKEKKKEEEGNGETQDCKCLSYIFLIVFSLLFSISSRNARLNLCNV